MDMFEKHILAAHFVSNAGFPICAFADSPAGNPKPIAATTNAPSPEMILLSVLRLLDQSRIAGEGEASVGIKSI
ncbi:MAG: hypothetical protein Q9M48_04635 [Rhodobacterales bacterium]|nr:hypothetical protein [Rhodobacterales bacterium]